MEIKQRVSQKIVEELYGITGKNINIMNNEGKIIASMDKLRVGQYHEAVREVLETGEEVYIKRNKDYTVAQEGINFPIFFQGKVIGVVGITGEINKVEKYGRIVKTISEILIMEEFNSKYRESRQTMISMAVTQALYADNIKGMCEITEDAGVYIEEEKIAILIKPKNIKDEYRNQVLYQRLIQKLENTMEYLEKKYFYSRTKSGILVVIEVGKENNNQDIKLLCNKIKEECEVGEKYSIVMAISEVYKDFKVIKKMYRQAEIAMKVACENGEEKLYYKDLDLETLLLELGDESRNIFYKKILLSIESDETLMNTLVEFFNQNCSINDTAAAMYVHKNTLQYRLNKIKNLTGYDPRKFLEANRLYIALKVKRLIKL